MERISLTNVAAGEARSRTTGNVTFTSDGTHRVVALFDNLDGGADGPATIICTVGAGGDLTGLKLRRAASPDGTFIDWFSGTDFADAENANETLLAFTLNAHATAASGTFQLTINFKGVGAVEIQAASDDDTTLKIEVSY